MDSDIIYLIKLKPSDIYKYAVLIDGKDIVKFGRNPYSDYLQHKNYDRMMRYTNRHKKNEDWTKSGLKTRGFWSKHILWNEPNLKDSIKKTEKKFNIKIKKLKL